MSKYFSAVSIATVAIFLMTGCLRTTVNLAPFPDSSVGYVERKSFYVFGLFPDERMVQASEICPTGELTKLETKTSFLDAFLGGITFGIYYPKTLVGWCKT